MYKFCGNRGKFINFVDIGGNMHHWLRGDGPHGRPWAIYQQQHSNLPQVRLALQTPQLASWYHATESSRKL